MIELNIDDILDEMTVCVYCFDIPRGTSCCGENHFELAYVTEDETYLSSEVIVNEKEKT